MPSPGFRGWYVELDEALVEEFERIFPEHGMKTLLTSRAVIEAVRTRSIRSVSFSPEGTNVSRDQGRTESIDGGTEATDDDVEGTGN